jgi:hypothetical protein
MDRKSNFALFLFCLVLPAFLLLPVFPSICQAKTVTLGWDANAEPDVEGYVVYRNVGSPGPPFKYDDELPEDELQNPLYPRVAITGLNEHTRYYIAITAYDTQGNESNYSDQLCVEIVDSSIESCGAVLSAPGSSSESSGGGGGCFITAAGLKTASAIAGPFFRSKPAYILFSVFFLLIIGSARAILFRIRFKVKGYSFIGLLS